MAYREQRDLSGILFRNDDKKPDDQATKDYPDATGRATVNGVQYWVSAWTKTDKNGNKYQSLAFKAAHDQRGPVQPRPRPQANQSPQEQAGDDPSCPF